MSQAESISPETRQENFEQAVALSLHLWPALTLAVQNKWNENSGDDPEEVRAWFAGVVIELFPDFTALARFHATPAAQNKKKPANLEEPELEDVESRLLQVMTDEFNVDVDDDSSFEVAEQIVNLRAACIKGEFDEVEKLRQRWASRKGQKVTMHQAPEQDQDTDWEDDDEDGEDDDDGDDGDVKMDEAPKVPKEKPQPEIDEDGFTKVTKKR